MRLFLAALLALLLPVGGALALNGTITSQIANAPAWKAGTAYASRYAASVVTVASPGTSCVNNDLVTARGGNGAAAKFYVTVQHGAPSVSAVGPAGAYSVVPSNPVSVTGGSCVGLTLDVTWKLLRQRVVAGPGLASGSYVNGSALYLWEAQTEGISAGSGNGPQSCPTPGTSTASEGSVTWLCKAKIDYVTLTGYLFDNPAWAARKSYPSFAMVTSGTPLRAYFTQAACTSGGTAPAGTGNPSDGGCAWNYVADITYTSKVSHIPTEECISHGIYDQRQDYYVGVLWSGGVARQEYVPGSNGEMNPIAPFDHVSSNGTICNGGSEPPLFCENGRPWGGCGGAGATSFYTTTIEPAAGDAFNSVATRPLSYNSSAGVSIHSTSPSSGIAIPGGNFYVTVGSAVFQLDFGTIFNSLQIKADAGIAIDMYARTANVIMNRVILDSGGWSGSGGPLANLADGLYVDTGSNIANSLIIYRGSQSGAIGFYMKYGVTSLLSSTVVNLGSGANSDCIATIFPSDGINFSGPPYLNGDLCIGFVHQFAYGSGAYSTLAAGGIDNSATTLVTTGHCCDSGGDDALYVQVDREIMQVTAGYNTASQTVIRGQLGTTAAPHAAGAIVAGTAGDYDVKQRVVASSYNAMTNPPLSAPVTFTNFEGFKYAESNLPAVGSTCAGGAAFCGGLAAAKQFMNPTNDFRLKAGAGVIGGSASVSANGGLLDLDNRIDILNQARPKRGPYDIGASQSGTP